MKKICVVVKKDFVDKYSGLKHKAGEKLTVTDARLREINRSGKYAEYDKKATEAMIADEQKKAAEKAASDPKK